MKYESLLDKAVLIKYVVDIRHMCIYSILRVAARLAGCLREINLFKLFSLKPTV